jgi:hypothetical protein
MPISQTPFLSINRCRPCLSDVGKGVVSAGRPHPMIEPVAGEAIRIGTGPVDVARALVCDMGGRPSAPRSRRLFGTLVHANAENIASAAPIAGRPSTCRVPEKRRTRARPAVRAGSWHCVSSCAAGTIDDPLVSSGTIEARPTGTPVPGVSSNRGAAVAARPRPSGRTEPCGPAEGCNSDSDSKGSLNGQGPFPPRFA